MSRYGISLSSGVRNAWSMVLRMALPAVVVCLTTRPLLADEEDCETDPCLPKCDPCRCCDTYDPCDPACAGIHLEGCPPWPDTDADGIPNACDNCPFQANPTQADTDADGVGDVCDNCPLVANPTQADVDGDGIADACDNCPLICNSSQTDTDSDGTGDMCDPDQVAQMPMVTIGSPGNAADTTGYGAVAYTYRMGTCEVTNAQYATFLSTIARADPNACWNSFMTRIIRSGASGSYTYRVTCGWENKPVQFTSLGGVLRFCNWLHNGHPVGAQGSTTTEDGVYDISLGMNTVRKAVATWYLPNENEWYKAAYYDANKEGGAGYYHYPTKSDSMPSNQPPWTASNRAGYPPASVLDIGTCTASAGPWATYDQGGNVGERIELYEAQEFVRGGGYSLNAAQLGSDQHYRPDQSLTIAKGGFGFRVGLWPDTDNDGIRDRDDNCVFVANTNQLDTDSDGVGDACDNCASLANSNQADSDWDGAGDGCDNCPIVQNPSQTDTDGDGIGDLCDNCPSESNADQADQDLDHIGDACDPNDGTNEIRFHLRLGGYNDSTVYENNQIPRFNASSATDEDDGVYADDVITWSVMLSAAGTTDLDGPEGNPEYPILGVANVSFSLELRKDGEPVQIGKGSVTTPGFFSTINDGDADGARGVASGMDPEALASFAYIVNPDVSVPARLCDTSLSGGPHFKYTTYPHTYQWPDHSTSPAGVLAGMGAGYGSFHPMNAGGLEQAGVGVIGPFDTVCTGFGMGPIAEGQINIQGLGDGTYTLTLIPGTGNNILRGDILACNQATDNSFARKADLVYGDSISMARGQSGPSPLRSSGGVASKKSEPAALARSEARLSVTNSGASHQDVVPIKRPFLVARPYRRAELAELIKLARKVSADPRSPEGTSSSLVGATQPSDPASVAMPLLSGPCPYTIPPYDLDLDGDVDQDDFGIIQRCVDAVWWQEDRQSVVPYADCPYADLDADNDVDSDDLNMFALCNTTGPGVPGDPRCGDCSCNGILDTFEIKWCEDCYDLDADNDTVPDECDNCPTTANGFDSTACDRCQSIQACIQCGGEPCANCPDWKACRQCEHPEQYYQVDADGDGVGDVCDNCPTSPNADQRDTDSDGMGDACDHDDDADGVPDTADNCPRVANANQADRDHDGVGDGCDNCIDVANFAQADADGDQAGDACDSCPVNPNPRNVVETDCNRDGDTIDSGESAAQQCDIDGDGLGDVCDPDIDGDEVANAADNCPLKSNPDQLDADGDQVGDACDNCHNWSNPQQSDFDNDGVGNDCDNCIDYANSGQEDNDHDGIGDACAASAPVDVKVDSDNNNGHGMPARSYQEELIEDSAPGKVISINSDYDNGNLLPDKDVDGAIASEDDLYPVVVTIKPTGSTRLFDVVNCYLNYPEGRLRLWKSARRGSFAADVVYSGGPTSHLIGHRMWMLGDMNGDELLNDDDVDALDLALHHPDTYRQDYARLFTSYPDFSPAAVGDVNGDGAFNENDQPRLEQAIALQVAAYVPLRLWMEGLASDALYPTIRVELTADTDRDEWFESSDGVDVTIPGEAWCSANAAVLAGEDCQAEPGQWQKGGCMGGGDPGFHLQLNLHAGFGPADLPPLKVDPVLSSAPMVSKEVSHFLGSQNKAERQTHNDVIDLATGQPLIQETDFELPFGSAVFRHIRTYSESPTDHGGIGNPVMQYQYHKDQRTFWDWNGLNWMMSENPILLIDADYCWNNGEPKKCYFIPDAHHSIPFIYDETLSKTQRSGTPQYRAVYVAPPWFDGILENNGELNADGTVKTHATQFYLWLQGKSIKYTFEVHEEDTSAAAHLSPTHPCMFYPTMEFGNRPCDWPVGAYSSGDGNLVSNNGTPYYGLVTKIEDHYGNVAEYEYCGVHQWNCPWQNTSSTAKGPLPECSRCCMTCNQKGQLKTIRLRSGNSVVWTLLYTHRAYGDPQDWPVDYTQSGYRPHGTLHYPHVLHSIHVYHGPITVSDDCLTLDASSFCWASSLADMDQLNHPSLPNGWVIEAKYLYDEMQYRADLPQPACPTSTLYCNAVQDSLVEFNPGGHLLKTTITRRSSRSGQEVTKSQYRLYRYGTTEPPMAMAVLLSDQLSAVYGPETIVNILATMRATPRHEAFMVNALLNMKGTDTVLFRNPKSGAEKLVALKDLADLTLDWRYEQHGEAPNILPSIEYGGFLVNIPQQYFINEIGQPAPRTVPERDGTRELVDRRSSSHPGTFRFYYYHVYPDTFDPAWRPDPGYDLSEQPAMIHYPYRYVAGNCWAATQFNRIPAGSTFYATVVDELDTTADVAYEPNNRQGIRSRRIVEMDVAGLVIRNRVWSYDRDGNGELISQTGSDEMNIHDCMGRVVETRTRAWGAEDNTDKLGEGLVYAYDYADRCECEGESCIPNGPIPSWRWRTQQIGEPIAVSIKRGTGGDKLYLSEIERHPEKPELIIKEKRYPEPVTEAQKGSADADITSRFYTLEDYTDEDGFPLKRIREVAEISPPAPLTSGPTQVHAVRKTRYRDDGNEEWTSAGSWSGTYVDTLTSLTPVRVYVNQQSFDEQGRLESAVIDTTATYNGFARTIPPGDDDSPLNNTTRYVYDDVYGLIRTILNEGTAEQRETRIAYVMSEDGTKLQQWLFQDLVPQNPNQPTGALTCISPVKINIFDGDRQVEALEVKLDTVTGDFDGIGETYIVLSNSTPQYDEQGRVAGIAKSAGSTTISAGIAYDRSGNVSRSQDPSGTITRYVYDDLGRLSKTYRGTQDWHEAWGTAVCCTPGVDPGCTQDPCHDDLVLIEKRKYGVGVFNANKLTEVRHLRDKPTNQYPIAGGDPSNEDTLGWISRYYYDWRLREVLVQDHDASDTVLKSTVTWYDNLNRVRLTAEFGSAVPACADPRNLPTGRSAPTATDIASILNPANRTRLLTENIYNHRGEIEEIRQYHDAVRNGENWEPRYTVTRTYYDHAGRTVETHSPGGGIQKYKYDAKGRQTSSTSIAADLEISRTRTLYNYLDQAYESVRWERKHNATGNLDTDGIQAWTYAWYDQAGKVIATADIGTGSATNSYANDNVQLPAYNGQNPPATLDSGGHVTACLNTQFGSNVHVSCYDYDQGGREWKVFHPDGTVTENEYDGLGRLILTTEDATGLRRQTAYLYECGSNPQPGCTGNRLVAMAAVLPGHHSGNVSKWSDIDWAAADGTLQVTRFDYGAEVIGGTLVTPQGGDPYYPTDSANNDWIKQVHYPDPATGQPGEAVDLAFKYYSDGAVAFRGDRKGNEFWYHYDELARLVRTDVTTRSSYAAGTPTYTPPAPIHHINYDYDTDGRLSFVTAYATSGRNAIIAQNKLQYDLWGNLSKEWQAHGAAVDDNTPYVSYTWDYRGTTSGGAGADRLETMSYPHRPAPFSTEYRTVTFNYTANVIDNALNRVSALQESGPPWASYQYMGASQRISTTYGNGSWQSVVGGAGYAGLDRFGRVQDLWFQHNNVVVPSDKTLYRHQYTYDPAGNRIQAQFTRGAGVVDDRSYYYNYDGLNRLIEADRGPFTFNNGELSSAGHYTKWGLDILGNWTGNDQHPSGRLEQAANRSVVSDVSQQVDLTNRITQLSTDGNDQSFVYDLAGNLVFDGQYVYLYDAWNRLIEVNRRGTLVYISPESTADDFTAAGLIDATATGHSIGYLVMQMVYDGIGRLIEVRRPHVAEAGGLRPPCDLEAYYYDGVRRIQTRVATEVDQGGVVQVLPGGWRAEREYIYGPEYVDEFIAQVDDPATATPTTMYMLQGANYNVSAILNNPAEGQPPTMLAEYTYDPYGQPVYTNEPSQNANTWNTVGHQGLFFYRLDFQTDNTPPPAGPNLLSPLNPQTTGLYYNRNRWYSPRLGRFTSRDPNETAMPVVHAMLMNADSPSVLFEAFSATGHFSDGMNLYRYEGSNPISHRDPNGLSWDEDFDSQIDSMVGQNMYALGMINEGAKWASLGLKTALGVASSFIPGSGLYDAFNAIEVVAGGAGGFWEALDIASAAFPFVKAGAKLLAKGGKMLAMGAMRKAIGFARRGCHSFVAGTLVDTPEGQRAIESIGVGDEVTTRDERTASGQPVVGRVTRVIRGWSAMIVWLSLSNGQLLGATPGHQVWTVEHGWTAATDLQVGEWLQNAESELVQVLAIQLDQTMTPV